MRHGARCARDEPRELRDLVASAGWQRCTVSRYERGIRSQSTILSSPLGEHNCPPGAVASTAGTVIFLTRRFVDLAAPRACADGKSEMIWRVVWEMRMRRAGDKAPLFANDVGSG